MSIALLLLTSFVSVNPTPVPHGVYILREEKGPWQPIEPEDLGQAVEHAALEALSAPGLLRLERADAKGTIPADADFVLRIFGRTTDEAETHSVYLSFEPVARTGLAGFRAADTVVIGKRPRAVMLSCVETSARTAATALLRVLSPTLRATPETPASAAAIDAAPLPWTWADVRVPDVSSENGRDLYSPDHDKRAAALRALTSGALSSQAPRNVLESCVLKHPDADVRLGCLQALRPLSRRLAATQRVVIEAFRKDKSSDVRAEANEQMAYFTGLSRADAVLAWLERAAQGEVMGPIQQLGDVPNLDVVIARCLVASGRRPKYQRSKASCIELLGPLTPARRWTILARCLKELDPESPYYLEGAGEREGSIGTDWQRAAEAVLENARRFPPELEDILWRRYERTLSSSALDIMGDYAEPSEKLATHLLEVVQTAGDRGALSSLSRIGKGTPALRPMIKERLAEMVATSSFPKTVSADDLERVVHELEGKR